jgi:hypothetical protein
MEVCVKLQLHFESAPPISNTQEHCSALGTSALRNEMMKIMIQEYPGEHFFG